MKYLKLLRVNNYVKNFYIFMPAFFSGMLLTGDVAFNSGLAFVLFSLMASAIYIFNDMRDLNEDRLHPTKRNRPIASGAISPKQALGIGIGLVIIALGGSWFFRIDLFYVLLAYFLLNLAYSYRLKHIAILDISIVSLGFILRIEAGHAVTGILISKWLMMMVFLLSMFQAMAKRLDDISVAAEQGVISRKSIDGYNSDFLKIALSIFSAVLVVCYIIYITQPVSVERLGSNSYFTVFPVLLGVLRYLQLLYVHKRNYNPVKIILQDHFLQLVVLAWVGSFAFLLYV